MTLMEKSFTSEKRKHPRFNVDLPVKYSRTDFFSRYGRAINASEGGLLVHLQEEMGIGQRLALKLFFPSRSELNSIAPFVQVVWTGIHMRKNFTWDYRTGVKFVDTSPEDITKFKNFIMSLSQKPPYTS